MYGAGLCQRKAIYLIVRIAQKTTCCTDVLYSAQNPLRQKLRHS